jgi:hypothetical protein
MSANDLDCVKTPKSNLRIEISSRLRQFKEHNADDRFRESIIEKTILRVPRAHTFSHSLGPIADIETASINVRFRGQGRHRLPRSKAAAAAA